MAEYVILTLAAPMGSFGGPAGHERRGSRHWPARSAILGLVGAAMGIRRDDAEGQRSLRAWSCAVSVLSNSQLLHDFHTVQTVPVASIKRPDTRRAALAALKRSDNATLTRRDYHTDCTFGVTLWGTEGAQAVADALNTPKFTPYLGRKSCPLAAPMAARVVSAETPQAALAQVTLPPWQAGATARQIISDAPLPGGWQETLWDDPIDRTGWHFAQHVVHIAGGGG